MCISYNAHIITDNKNKIIIYNDIYTKMQHKYSFMSIKINSK